MKSLSPVRLFATPMDCSLPGFSIHAIFQARGLEWVAISFSKGSSRPRDRTQVFPHYRQTLYRLGSERGHQVSSCVRSCCALLLEIQSYLFSPSVGAEMDPHFCTPPRLSHRPTLSVFVQAGGRDRAFPKILTALLHSICPLCVQTYSAEVLAESPSSQLCFTVSQSGGGGAVTRLMEPPWILEDLDILRASLVSVP